MKRIIVVRHGGHKDNHLTSDGEEQARWAAKAIAHFASGIGAAVSSSQSRAAETLQIILREAKLDLQPKVSSELDALTEEEKARVVPKTKEVMAKTRGLTLEEALYYKEVGFQEDLIQRGDRAFNALWHLLRGLSGENVLVVTHGGSVIEPVAWVARKKMGREVAIDEIMPAIGGMIKCGEILIIELNDSLVPTGIRTIRRQLGDLLQQL